MRAVVLGLPARAMALMHTVAPVRDSAPHSGFPLEPTDLEVS